ncbi:MAG: hypothetical protein QFB86_01130 [Patescibacteria group bacterium]|nr:hypothetical protein [Patescibacteria group bacterium]
MPFTAQYDIAILLPQINPDNYERSKVRYQGLSDEIHTLGFTACFAHSQVSYDADTSTFEAVTDAEHSQLAAHAAVKVVRDLTMPKNPDLADLYNDVNRPALVHAPALNDFLRNKADVFALAPEIHPITVVVSHEDVAEAVAATPGSRVIVKPVTGMAGKGVELREKHSQCSEPQPGGYLVQEYVDSSEGMPEFGVTGTHNIRIISIGSKAIGAIARINPEQNDMLKNDVYGAYIDPDTLPNTMKSIVDRVHEVLSKLAGSGSNVIAIDVMRGRDSSGKVVDKLCEVNRRPQRISLWDAMGKEAKRNTDLPGIRKLAKQWDIAEAELLVSRVR